MAADRTSALLVAAPHQRATSGQHADDGNGDSTRYFRRLTLYV